jgi:hypothetical protein
MSRARHKEKHREAGGKVPGGSKAEWAGGEPDVEREAEAKKRGGSIHAAKAKHHLGKRGRATGGRIGADRAPLSSAHSGDGGYEAHKHGGRAMHRKHGGRTEHHEEHERD